MDAAVKHGATVDSFDYSNAVEANAANNGADPRLSLVQADIRKIMGLRSNRIKSVLGYKPYDEVIHRDNLALTGEFAL